MGCPVANMPVPEVPSRARPGAPSIKPQSLEDLPIGGAVLIDSAHELRLDPGRIVIGPRRIAARARIAAWERALRSSGVSGINRPCSSNWRGGNAGIGPSSSDNSSEVDTSDAEAKDHSIISSILTCWASGVLGAGGASITGLPQARTAILPAFYTLALFGRISPLPTLPGAWVKHAAQGSAILADALAGGRFAPVARVAPPYDPPRDRSGMCSHRPDRVGRGTEGFTTAEHRRPPARDPGT